MLRSESVKEVAAALAKAQAEFTVAKCDKFNKHFGSWYPSLKSIREACVPALNKHGIALTQGTRITETKDLILVTTITHGSGEFMASEMPVIDPVKPQGMGSSLTYSEKYSITSFLGVTSEEDHDDDDGEKAMGRFPDNIPKGSKNLGEHAMARSKDEPFETAHFKSRGYKDPESPSLMGMENNIGNPQAKEATKNHTHKYSAATHKCFIGIRDESGKYRECGALDPES